MTTQPDIDAIARDAAHSHVIGTPLQPVIIAAIRRALEPLEQENKDMAKAMALKLKLERHLSEALSERDTAVNRIFDLKRTNQMLAEQLQKHADAIAERDALEKVAKAADQLEAMLGRNCGSNDDWPIEIKVSGDYAKRLTEKLNALSGALKPYREKMK